MFCRFRLALLAAVSGLLSTPAVAQPTWVSALQTAPTTEAIIYSTATDPQGNVYVAGFVAGPTQFGAFTVGNTLGGLSGFVAKRSGPTGQWLWATATGGFSEVELTGLAVDAAGNAYVSGGFGGAVSFGSQTFVSPSSLTGFVAHLTPAGQWDWVQRIGGGTSDTRLARLALNSAGTTVYAAGLFDGTAQVGSASHVSAGWNDALVVALAATTGQVSWSQVGGGPGFDLVEAVATDAAGAVYVVGGYEGTATVGPTSLASTASYSPFAGRLDAAGNWQWVTGSTAAAECYSITVDPRGGQVAIGGYLAGTATFGPVTLTSQGDEDVLLAFLDPATGAWQGAAQAGGSPGDIATAIGLAYGVTGLMVTGGFEGTLTLPTGPAPLTLTSAGAADAFVARYVGGTTGWYDALRAGGTGEDYGAGLAVSPASLPGGAGSLVHVSGYFDGPTAEFGTTTLTNTVTTPDYTGGPGFLADATFGPLLLGSSAAADAATFTLVPNPATTTVRLTLPAAAAAREITICDALGRPVRRLTSASQQTQVTLDLRGLPAGLYVVRCGETSRRLVIE